MGVMCSLLGHDYGDTDVERERSERGDEVVRTAKRVERCRNCDHTRTISENTEVTALSAAVGVVREPDGTVVAAMDEPEERRSESTDGVDVSGVERHESDDGIAAENRETESAPDPVETDRTDANENERLDGVGIDRILDDEPEIHERTHRAPGEWPSEPEHEANTQTAATPRTKSNGGFGSSGSLATVESRVGRWPGETDAAGNGHGNQPVLDGGTGRSSDSFACTSCGFTAAVADSPLRAGDICPGCGHGYLAWETRKG